MRNQALAEGKPEKIVDKMVAGRIDKYYTQICLMDQPYIKDDELTVSDVVKDAIARIGENINVRRFVRYEMGAGLEKKEDDFVKEVAEMTRS